MHRNNEQRPPINAIQNRIKKSKYVRPATSNTIHADREYVREESASREMNYKSILVCTKNLHI